MTHDRVPPTTQPLAQAWRTTISRQLVPEERDLLYLRYIEGFDTAALAEALQLRADTLEGPQGRLQAAERHLMEAYASCHRPGTVLPPLTPAELVRQLFPTPHVSLPADFAPRVLAQVAKLRQVREQRLATVAHDSRASRPAPVARLVGALAPLWASLAWHPPFAGEPVTAGQTTPRTERFPSPYGEIQATCAWHAASASHPATLRLTWQARLIRPGDIWVRFVSRDDPAVQLSEGFCLGSGVTGVMEWSAATLGFDPTLVPWSLVLFLTEPQR